MHVRALALNDKLKGPRKGEAGNAPIAGQGIRIFLGLFAGIREPEELKLSEEARRGRLSQIVRV